MTAFPHRSPRAFLQWNHPLWKGGIMAKKKSVKAGTRQFVMLKEDWPPAGFRRTVRGADGEVVRVLRFAPGKPVELCEQDFAAVENDIGPALLLVEESTIARRPTSKAQAARTINAAPKIKKAVAKKNKTGFPKWWDFQRGSVLTPLSATYDMIDERLHLQEEQIVPPEPVSNIFELIEHLRRWQSQFDQARAAIRHAEDILAHDAASDWRTRLLNETRRELGNANRACHEWMSASEQPQFNAMPADITEAGQQIERLIYSLANQNQEKRLKEAKINARRTARPSKLTSRNAEFERLANLGKKHCEIAAIWNLNNQDNVSIEAVKKALQRHREKSGDK